MSFSSRESLPASQVDGQTVTNWRLIWITGAVEIFLLAGLMVAWPLFAGLTPRPERAPTQPHLAMVVRHGPAPPVITRVAPAPELGKIKPDNPPPPSKSAASETRLAATSKSSTLPAEKPALPEKRVSAGPKIAATPSRSVSIPKPSDAPLRQAALVTLQEAAAASSLPEPPPFKWLNHLYEDQLAELLCKQVPEVGVDTVKGTSTKLFAQASTGKPPAKVKTVLDLLAERPDLNDLPLRRGVDCQADAATAQQLQSFSRALRGAMSSGNRSGPLSHSSSMQSVYFQNTLFSDLSSRRLLFEEPPRSKQAAHPSWPRVKEEAISTFAQLLQAEGQPLRVLLVRLLAASSTRAATVALAQRAQFDLSQEIREEAVQALRERPADDYRQLLLDGLRYPWAPVADHAAEALVALQDRRAIPHLVDLLDQADPAAPVQREDKKWVIPELVRVNHLRNCVLCHAPSHAATDLVRGPVPTPGEPLPPIDVYYGRIRGNAVRADVTYLRQDFSVCQPVPDHDKWPEQQRFDYLVRKRELSDNELKHLMPSDRSASYPQREAVLFALCELTGKDLGPATETWRKYFANKAP